MDLSQSHKHYTAVLLLILLLLPSCARGVLHIQSINFNGNFSLINFILILIAAGWPNFLCVCSVFSSGSVQLHWSQWPPNQNGTPSKWFCTSKGLLGAGPSGIMAADAIITDSGAMHVAGVPIVNPSTVVVWEVTPGPGNGFQAIPKTSVSNGVPPSLNPPSWDGFAPLAAYLFSWQECLLQEAKQGKKLTEQHYNDMVALHCSPVSNFSAYVSPEAAAQSTATTTWGSGVTAVAFDPTRGGSVIAVVIVEGTDTDLMSLFALQFFLVRMVFSLIWFSFWH